MQLRAALLTAVVLCAAYAPAGAVEPVGAPSSTSRPASISRPSNTANFYDVLVPAAKAEGRIVFYDFGELEKDLFAEIIRRFEAKYPGVKIDYHQVDGEQAVQQLIAAKTAGQPSPVDIFWMPNGQVRVANEAGVIANLPLNTMLPTAPDIAENPATVSRGYVHGGVVAPFHRNQTAIGFDTRSRAARAASRNPSPNSSPSPRPTRRRSRSPTRPRAARAAASSRPRSSP